MCSHPEDGSGGAITRGRHPNTKRHGADKGDHKRRHQDGDTLREPDEARAA